MKKKLLIFLLNLSVMVSAEADVAPGVKAAIAKRLPGTRIDAVFSTVIPGVIEVHAGNNVFYATASGRYLVFGHLYDSQMQRDLTPTLAPNTNSKKTIQWSTLSLQDAIVLHPHAKQALAVFLDPDCPHCRDFIKQVDQLTRLKVFVFLRPLVSLHPQAKQASGSILCAKSPVNALIRYVNGKTLSSPICQSSPLDRLMAFADKENIRATPTLVRSDGQIHLGGLSTPSLLRWLNGLTGEKNHETRH